MCVPLALAGDHPSFCIQIGARCFCTSLTHFSVVSLVQIGGLDRIGYFRSLNSCTIPCSVTSPAFSNADTLCQSVCITTLSLVAYSGFKAALCRLFGLVFLPRFPHSVSELRCRSTKSPSITLASPLDGGSGLTGKSGRKTANACGANASAMTRETTAHLMLAE